MLRLTSIATAFLLMMPASTLASPTPAPQPIELDPLREPLSSGAIQAALDRLDVVGTVLYVAAHPDDENTRLLAWLAGQRGLRAVYVSLTRGDGGQNLVGDELGPLLGLIRTHELLAARRIDGAEQRFTRAIDFGYSKSADESLALWGKDAVLSDLVHVVREVRPDVMVTRFSTEPPNHGHHIASALLAREAFDAAADPARYPEQPTAHAVARLFENKSHWRFKEGQDLSGYLTLDVGAYSPLIGRAFAELAAASRTMHKSQGFGSAPTHGPQPEYFELVASRGTPPPGKDPLEGLDFSWGRLPGTKAVQKAVTTARTTFVPAHPERSIPAVVEVRKALLALPDAAPHGPWKRQKLAEVDALLVALAGLHLDVRAPTAVAVPGEPLAVSARLLARSAPVELTGLAWPHAAPTAEASTLAVFTPVERKASLALPKDAMPSTPRWLREPRAGHLFALDPAQAIHPVGPPDLALTVSLRIGGEALTVATPIRYGWVDPVHGERFRPVEILPPVTVTPRAHVLMLPNGKAGRLEAVVTAHGAARAGTVRVVAPAGWTTSEPVPFTLKEDNAEQAVSFTVTPPAGASVSELRLVATVEGREHDRARRLISHVHIPMTSVLSPAAVRATPFQLELGPSRLGKKATPRIGYIAGAGDEVGASLAAVGYEVVPLTSAMLEREDLSRFDAIVAGIRAFNTDPTLEHRHAALMRYVEQGGTYLVQYVTSTRFRPLGDVPIGPFPFDIDQSRVTDERAAMKVLDPKHPVVSIPNILESRDFDGWVQERGLYFSNKWDPRYTPIFEAADPGEAPLQGGLIVARHGKGAFAYTGLAFFRQLPEGVPGAYRLFANLLALGRAGGSK